MPLRCVEAYASSPLRTLPSDSRLVRNSQVINEISDKSQDSIIGIGERLSCKIVAAALRDQGIDSEMVSFEHIVQAALADDVSQDDLEPLDEFSLGQEFYDRLAKKMGERLLECGSRVPVVTGATCFVVNLALEAHEG